MAFLVFEGLDGCGKSTLIKRLSNFLKEHGIESVCTREPGGTVIGEKLRDILIANSKDAPSLRTEILLYEAIRAENVEKVIRPALKKDLWVLSDRYSASTQAFQCGGRNIDESVVKWLNDYATGGLQPDCWIFIDLSLEQAEERMSQRLSKGQKKDRFEQENRKFHQSVLDEYKKMAQQDSWVVLDGSQSIEKVFRELLSQLAGKKIISDEMKESKLSGSKKRSDKEREFLA